MKIIVFANGIVGHSIVDYLIKNFKEDILAIVTIKEDDIFRFSISQGVTVCTFDNWLEYVKISRVEFDFGILAWWPKIVKSDLMSLAKQGFVNTHPSLLPYNRGKNYNFWAIVEQAPFGVTLHMIDQGIDTGPILAQKEIKYTWLDNGQTLYEKAQSAMQELFFEFYPQLRSGNYTCKAQDLSMGSYHHSSELNTASKIDLNKKYIARDILNLLRARTFAGYPACWFEDNGTIYEISIKIKKIENEHETKISRGM